MTYDIYVIFHLKPNFLFQQKKAGNTVSFSVSVILLFSLRVFNFLLFIL